METEPAVISVLASVVWVHAPILSPVEHIEASDLDKCIAVNLRATQRLIRVVDPLLRRSDAARALFFHDPDACTDAYHGAYGATKAAGLEPRLEVIRGGTDGSLLTAAGLPTPNISSGQHNPHCPLEWTSLEELEDCLKVVIELCKLWGEEQI